jgi:pyruvate kinase
MLSEESAMGSYPVEAVDMLARIATATEAGRHGPSLMEALSRSLVGKSLHEDEPQPKIADVIAWDAADAVDRLNAGLVLTPTINGVISRLVARFRLPAWIVAFSPHHATCQRLCFTFGVQSVEVEARDGTWAGTACSWLREQGLEHGLAVITHRQHFGPGSQSNRLEIIELEDFLRGESWA